MCVMRWRLITSSRRGMSSTSPSSMSTSPRMSRMSHSSRWRAKMTGRCPSCTNLRLASAPMTPIPAVIWTFMPAPYYLPFVYFGIPCPPLALVILPCRCGAGDRMTNAQWHGIDQHEGDAGALVAAVGPGVVGAALDHHVPSLHLHRRIVHVHLDLALEHDHIIDRLRAVHPRRITGREIDDREAVTVRRRRGANDARPQILDLFSDCDVGRRAVGRPDERRDRSRTRMLGIGGRTLHDHFGDMVGVMAGHETPNGRVWRSHHCLLRSAEVLTPCWPHNVSAMKDWNAPQERCLDATRELQPFEG